MSYNEFERKSNNKDLKSLSEDSSLANNESESSLDWAKEVYAKLKEKQEAEKLLEQKKQLEDTQLNNEKFLLRDSLKDSSIEINSEKTSSSPIETKDDSSKTISDSERPVLGEMNETFTWSAEILASQGKKIDQVSLEEIDWLSRLRQGLEKTRQGFSKGKEKS